MEIHCQQIQRKKRDYTIRYRPKTFEKNKPTQYSNEFLCSFVQPSFQLSYHNHTAIRDLVNRDNDFHGIFPWKKKGIPL